MRTSRKIAIVAAILALTGASVYAGVTWHRIHMKQVARANAENLRSYVITLRADGSIKECEGRLDKKQLIAFLIQKRHEYCEALTRCGEYNPPATKGSELQVPRESEEDRWKEDEEALPFCVDICFEDASRNTWRQLHPVLEAVGEANIRYFTLSGYRLRLPSECEIAHGHPPQESPEFLPLLVKTGSELTVLSEHGDELRDKIVAICPQGETPVSRVLAAIRILDAAGCTAWFGWSIRHLPDKEAMEIQIHTDIIKAAPPTTTPAGAE